MSEPLWQPRSDTSARLLGAGFFLFGAWLLGDQILDLQQTVEAGTPRVSYLLAAFAMGELALGLGGYWLVRGLAGYAAVRALQRDPRRMKFFLAAATIVLGATLLAVQAWLKTQGYDS